MIKITKSLFIKNDKHVIIEKKKQYNLTYRLSTLDVCIIRIIPLMNTRDVHVLEQQIHVHNYTCRQPEILI